MKLLNKLILEWFSYCVVDLYPPVNKITRTDKYWSKEVMEKALGRYNIIVKQKKAAGVLHYAPLGDDDIHSVFEIDLRDVSHIIRKIWRVGNKYKALIKVVDNYNGKNLRCLLNDDMVEFMIRAAGTVQTNETLAGTYQAVADGLKIISWDAYYKKEYRNG